MRRFAPDQVAVRRVRQAARDRLIDARLDPEEAFGGAFAGAERAVDRIDVAGEQRRGFGVGPRDQHGRHVEHVHRQSGGDEILDRLLGRDEHFAAEMAALLLRRQLVFEMDAGRAGFDHRLGQLEHVERAAEAGFHVGHDRHEPVVF